jgi:RNA polymerase sigma factor (sigma-70 family)
MERRTSEQVTELHRIAADSGHAGCADARADLLKHHEGLALKQIGRYTGKGLSYDDLKAEALLALWHALDHYDPRRGFRFSTFAVKVIRRRVKKALDLEQKHRNESVDYQPVRGGDAEFLDSVPTTAAGPEAVVTGRVSPAWELVSLLAPRERRVIWLRYGDPMHTTRDTALLLGCSKQYVNQLEHKALRMLRHAYVERGVDKTGASR